MIRRYTTSRVFLALLAFTSAYFVQSHVVRTDPAPKDALALNASRKFVTWKSCSEVSVVLGGKNLSQEKERLVRESLDIVASATGLSFNIIGTTKQVPQTNWALRGKKASGAAYPPVYIGWLDYWETDILEGGDTLGAAVANPAVVNSRRQLVTGAVVFNNYLYPSLKASSGPGETKRNLVLHELGHLVGLNHAATGGIMHGNPDRWPSGFTARDLLTFGALTGNC